MKTKIIITILIVIIAILGFMYYKQTDAPTGIIPSRDGDTTVCTMEAKQCPDGSYVGRGGPNCEFAECPTGVKADVKIEAM